MIVPIKERKWYKNREFMLTKSVEFYLLPMVNADGVIFGIKIFDLPEGSKLIFRNLDIIDQKFTEVPDIEPKALLKDVPELNFRHAFTNLFYIFKMHI